MSILVDKKGKLSVIENAVVENFGKRKCIWKSKEKTIYLYGRTKQKTRPIVKYDFPPPADIKTFYGECLIVNPNGPLTIEEWEIIYEDLFGGFEDIRSESDKSEDEYTGLPLSKEGYELDGFVVNSDNE
jgi:hypothetical protein